MAIKCPIHKGEVVTVSIKHYEIRTGFRMVLRAVLRVLTSKCPEFGCAYSVESDRGVIIRDNLSDVKRSLIDKTQEIRDEVR